MKKFILIVFVIVALVILAIGIFYQPAENSFQGDADVVRIEDVLYWTKLIEEYKSLTGVYPLSETVANSEDILLVRVATQQQQEYFDKDSESYRPDLDNNKSGTFQETSVAEFIEELEKGLNRDIDEHYDIQKVPTRSPVWYNYFVSEDGYLFWVTCVTCEVNWATTLLGDGYTPTINIGSSGITDGAQKLHTREEIMNLPDFVELMERKLGKEEYIRSLQAEYFDDSKY